MIALAQVVVALAEHPQAQPRHVVRRHDDLLLHGGPLLDDGDRAPDGEAVVLEEPGPLQLLHADELPVTPAAVVAAKGAQALRLLDQRALLVTVRRRRRRALVTHQSQLVLGEDDDGVIAEVLQVQRDEAGVLLGVAVEVAYDPPRCDLRPRTQRTRCSCRSCRASP